MRWKALGVWADLLAKLLAFLLALWATHQSCVGTERTNIAYQALLEAMERDINRLTDRLDRYQEIQVELRERLAQTALPHPARIRHRASPSPVLAPGVDPLAGVSRTEQPQAPVVRSEAVADKLLPASEPRQPRLRDLPRSLDMLIQQQGADKLAE